GENDAPVAVADDLGVVSEDGTLTAGPAGVLGNDSDAEGDTLTVTASDAVSAGGAAVTVGSDGSYSYDPNGAFDALASGQSATDSFGYATAAGNGGTASPPVALPVTGENDAPVAVADDLGVVSEDGTLTAGPAGVLGNDSDAEGDTLT